jgi:hypothetical protein
MKMKWRNDLTKNLTPYRRVFSDQRHFKPCSGRGYGGG